MVPNLIGRSRVGTIVVCALVVVVGALRLRATSPSRDLGMRSSLGAEGAALYPCLLYSDLYKQYADDLVRVRQLAARFCAAATDQQKGTPHLHHCLTGDMESEVLYLRIRHYRPANVFEVSSALGYSTMWILAALEDNDNGVLHSFDLHETPFPHVLSDAHRGRWTFHRGDMKTTFRPVADARPVDYLHIDTCHDEPCIQWYLRNVMEVVAAQVGPARPVHASMHDIYETYYPPAGLRPTAKSKRLPLREGNLVFEWLSPGRGRTCTRWARAWGGSASACAAHGRRRFKVKPLSGCRACKPGMATSPPAFTSSSCR